MALKDLFPKVLKPLIGDLDTPVFVTAGNLAHQYPKVNTVPAVLAADAVPDMVVVGGVAADGEHAHYYQDADYVKIYAPADEVETASFITDDAYENIDGTSAGKALFPIACTELFTDDFGSSNCHDCRARRILHGPGRQRRS